MSKSMRSVGFMGSLLSVDLFKRNQGRLARMWTWIGATVIVAWGAWTLHNRIFINYSEPVKTAAPVLIGLLGAWAAFRLIHYPRFADFLIDVEGEMAKVSWPAWPELWRATVVVLVTMFLISIVLFSYDMLWQFILQWLRILEVTV